MHAKHGGGGVVREIETKVMGQAQERRKEKETREEGEEGEGGGLRETGLVAVTGGN